MSLNVSQLQKRIAAIVDQDATEPTVAGDDWNLRLEFINMAQKEWSESYAWQVLYKEFYSQTSVSTGNATLSLPNDFRKLSSFPRIASGDGTSVDSYSEIRPQEKDQYSDTDKYVCIIGTEKDGYKMYIHPESLCSGASILVPYLSTPSSLATTTDVSPCPAPEYLIQRSIAYLWEAREDNRFPLAKAEADKILARLLEFESTYNDASAYDRVKTREEKYYSFRIGEN